MVRNFNRIRAAYGNAFLGEVEEDSSLGIALSVAVWGPLQALFYCYPVMILMEVIVGRLMTRSGM
jgi:hypothetical protein